MSHLKNPPLLNSSHSSKFPIQLLLLVAVAGSSGCAMIQIPSYRLEECATESYSSTPALLPSVPLPGCLARWKAEKKLPKPPESPRFHPLPTRPMFQPAPSQFTAGGPEAVCYGKLPAPETWNAGGSIAAPAMPTLAAPQ